MHKAFIRKVFIFYFLGLWYRKINDVDILHHWVWSSYSNSLIECIDCWNIRNTWLWHRTVVRNINLWSIVVIQYSSDKFYSHWDINEHWSLFFYCSCWLSVESGLIWAFIAPVILVLVVNTAMFIQALVIARKSLHKRTDSLKGEKMSTSSKLTLFKGTYIYISYIYIYIYKTKLPKHFITFTSFYSICRILLLDGNSGSNMDIGVFLFCWWCRSFGDSFHDYK